MTVRGIRIAGVVMVGLALAGWAGQAVLAQASQQVTPQIIQPDQEDEFTKGAVSFKTPGLVLPKVIRSTHPKYTPFALKAKLEGDVTLEAIIGVDGQVEKARVKEPLDPELDRQALEALDEWQFEAGRLNDAPVRVLVNVVMAFRVR